MSLRAQPVLVDVDLCCLWDPTFIHEKYLISSDSASLVSRKRPAAPQKKPQWHYFVSQNTRLWADNIISEALDTVERCFHAVDFLLIPGTPSRLLSILWP